jgi:hypothetical protein
MDDNPITDDSILLFDSNRGIYIPENFYRAYGELDNRDSVISGLEGMDWVWHEIMDVDGESYWDAWSTILDNAILTGDDGKKFTLYQDGDLWAIPLVDENKEN